MQVDAQARVVVGFALPRGNQGIHGTAVEVHFSHSGILDMARL
jgi:hypothetical protein